MMATELQLEPSWSCWSCWSSWALGPLTDLNSSLSNRGISTAIPVNMRTVSHTYDSLRVVAPHQLRKLIEDNTRIRTLNLQENPVKGSHPFPHIRHL